MVAIILFTIGVLALIGVQAAVMRATSDSKIRLDAEFFADQLISEMNADARSDGVTAFAGNPALVARGKVDVGRLMSRYNTGGIAFQRWRNRIIANDASGLPLSASNPPEVTVTRLLIPNSDDSAGVDVIIYWRSPTDDPAGPARRLVTTSVIN